MRKLKVEGDDSLVKDQLSKAVLASNVEDLKSYRGKREARLSTEIRLNRLETRVAELEAALRRIEEKR